MLLFRSIKEGLEHVSHPFSIASARQIPGQETPR